MRIREMFAEDINRPINGVIKVDQDTTDIVEQEVREYVITRELKKHFISFFDYYSDAFEKPTDNIGVWISGFFGSGKSHFLKMLSYILENRPIDGVPTVEKFRSKFAEDPATFMLIDRSTRGKTETILFNIDIEGSINKDKTAVLRVFAKMFYSHLGFFGENLKVAMLEQYIDQQGKTEEFRRVFEEKKGKSWVEQRKAFAFNGKFIVPTLMEVLDMSEEDARRWFDDKSAVEFSIAQLVQDIKAYVDKQPADFRLLFMADEAGQYVGTDTDMLLNLQSLTEKIGSECGGKVWVVCTGQEAIDEIIKVRADEFSRIQARFKTRLSLSSSSVDEVIQKRILAKKPQAAQLLERLYSENDSVLRNLFSFSGSVLDIKGYGGAGEFAADFPFVPYQFIIMQKVFAEIRKHGNSGKHLSGGERSMLSGFQEAAQKIQEKDEYALVPFFRFYDTVHTFLDSSIRRVIERCQTAADSGLGVKPRDVDVLKLLYMIRYVDDIPANLDNIVILMADDIRTDKIVLREMVSESLNNLMSQNYIGRTGETYNFLTDEEQDIQRDIRNTVVDTAAIVDRIAQIIYGDIYQTKKFRYCNNDFDFDKMVDGVSSGPVTGGMKLRFLTVATDAFEKRDFQLMAESKGQAIAVLSGTSYFEALENAMKIRKFIKQRNVAQLPKSVQEIIRSQQDEANSYELAAREALEKSIAEAAFYVDGEHTEMRGGSAVSRINQALEYLVAHVYSELGLVEKNTATDADVVEVLNSNYLPGAEPNRAAAAKVEEYLDLQQRMNLPTTMFDVQSRYQAAPYGWREIDVAAVVALLINQQKVTVKYGGATIRSDDAKLPDMLRKKSEIGKTSISIKQSPKPQQMRAAREILREYFDVMDVPDDEEGLVRFIIQRFSDQKEHYQALEKRYTTGRLYPDKAKVQKAVQLTEDILAQQKDNIALIERLLKLEDPLLDSKEELQAVEDFFKNQVQIFDAAVRMEEDLRNELDYLSREPAANDALNQIRLIVAVEGGFSYQKIPQLNSLMATVREGHGRLLEAKRAEVSDVITQCMGAVHTTVGKAAASAKAQDIAARADDYFSQKKAQLPAMESLALLDGLIPPLLQYKDQAVESLEVLVEPPVDSGSGPAAGPKKIIRSYNRAVIFPTKTIASAADVDDYVEKMREQLKTLLQNCDGIQLK